MKIWITNMNDRMTAAEYQLYLVKQKPGKYSNIKTEIDGIKFDSTKEANRYCELKILLRAGKISNLCRQVKFILIPGSITERALYYIADYVYTEDGQTIVEDVKRI